MIAPYYSDGSVTLYHGRMEDVLPQLGQFDACITDPPYGETSLSWDRWLEGWPKLVAEHTNSLWCFGSMRMFTSQWADFAEWKFAQDVVWEKNVGSSFVNDRFKRVHEHALHFYRGAWSDVRHDALRVPHHGVIRGVVKGRVHHEHTGEIGPQDWVDDGTRLMRSVIPVPNLRGKAIHPTEKPGAILDPLIRYSVPVGSSVLDPFAGSGSTLLTARSLRRRAVGIEANETFCEAAAKRLSIPDLFASLPASPSLPEEEDQ